eukprot:TRINITY_DN3555_c0_g1_i3.p1 TRINITY_DN3555_c0_g1~~TRINITY_DN3555_c0_g1_i3.p1  ORF type:complete len:436 (-),score=138.31 TRINITY_DN3555_c0_g1_i3:24-1205(-)
MDANRLENALKEYNDFMSALKLPMSDRKLTVQHEAALEKSKIHLEGAEDADLFEKLKSKASHEKIQYTARNNEQKWVWYEQQVSIYVTLAETRTSQAVLPQKESDLSRLWTSVEDEYRKIFKREAETIFETVEAKALEQLELKWQNLRSILMTKNREISHARCREVAQAFRQNEFPAHLASYRTYSDYYQDLANFRNRLKKDCLGPAQNNLETIISELKLGNLVRERLGELTQWWKHCLFMVFGLWGWLLLGSAALAFSSLHKQVVLAELVVGVLVLTLLGFFHPTVSQFDERDYLHAFWNFQDGWLPWFWSLIPGFLCHFIVTFSHLTSQFGWWLVVFTILLGLPGTLYVLAPQHLSSLQSVVLFVIRFVQRFRSSSSNSPVGNSPPTWLDK